MQAVKQLRRAAGLTQRALAARAGTSQATVAAYEAGRKSPTLRTLEGLAASAGLAVAMRFVPAMTREDRRSLAYHRAVVEAIRRDPDAALERACRTLRRLRRLNPHASMLLDQWTTWLALPLDELAARLEDPGLFARDMRQVSPFAGQLGAGERARVLREVRSGHEP